MTNNFDAEKQNLWSTLRTVLDRSTVRSDIGTISIPGPTYLGMWARDTAMMSLGLTRLGQLDRARDLLIRYWSYQITRKSDPQTFVFRNKGYAAWNDADAFQPTEQQLRKEVGAFPTCVYMQTPEFPAGTREIYGDRADPDGSAWLIIALHDYCVKANDLDFLRACAPSVRRAITYLRSRDSDGDHLLEQGPNQDWADVTLRYGKVSYTQAVWFQCLGAASGIFELVRDTKLATRCREEREEVREAINRILMTPYGYFAEYVADDHISLRRSLDTALLVAFGACDEEQGRRVLDVLDTLGGPFGPAVMEPGFTPHAMGPSKYPPGRYQNEGVWPWITAYLALAWTRLGEPQRARDVIYALFSNNAETTYEWIDGLSGEPHHADFATAAGALAWALSETDRTPV